MNEKKLKPGVLSDMLGVQLKVLSWNLSPNYAIFINQLLYLTLTGKVSRGIPSKERARRSIRMKNVCEWSEDRQHSKVLIRKRW